MDGMNPFLYKAHPLQYRLLNLLLDPGASSVEDALEPIAMMLALGLLWAPALVWAVGKADRLRLSLFRGYCLALPACLLYTPLMLTVVGDVAVHGFRFADRFFVVFALFVLSQMLAGFYAFALRHRPSGHPVGLLAGETVSLFLLLYSLPVASGLMGVNAVIKIF